MWGLGVDIIRRIFENEPGVVKIVSPERLHKRRYTTLRIPESVLRRIDRRLNESRADRAEEVPPKGIEQLRTNIVRRDRTHRILLFTPVVCRSPVFHVARAIRYR
jgi:hypothetical protein